MKYNLCPQHQEAVKKCDKGETKQSTIEEELEYNLIKDSVEKVMVDGSPMLRSNYPVMGDPAILFRPELSNGKQALAKSKALFRKLHKMGLAEEFDKEIQKSVAERHIRFLSSSEEQELLNNWHCFSGLTYSIKASSSSQKIRPCCYSSVYHPSGSLNSHLPLGTNLINSMVKILTQFRLNPFCVAVDLHRCYRSMKSDWTGSRLRATYYPSNPSDPNCNVYKIFVYERVSYGDSLAACLLEIMMRLFIAPACKSEAGPS